MLQTLSELSKENHVEGLHSYIMGCEICKRVCIIGMDQNAATKIKYICANCILTNAPDKCS